MKGFMRFLRSLPTAGMASLKLGHPFFWSRFLKRNPNFWNGIKRSAEISKELNKPRES